MRSPPGRCAVSPEPIAGELYFRSCEGEWTGRFELTAVRPGAAWRTLGLRGLGLFMLRGLTRVFPAPHVRTTVVVGASEPEGLRVDHTTEMAWLGVPVFQSREWIHVGDDPAPFGGEERGLTGWTPFPPGSVRFAPDATTADYALHFAGQPLAQQGQTDGAPHAAPPREARHFTLTQTCAAFDAVMRLTKR